VSWLALVFAGVLGAHAADDPDDDLRENTVSGGAKPAVEAPLELPPPVVEDPGNLAYAAQSYEIARVLHLDIAFADRCRRAIEHIYARKYKDAKRELEALTVDAPTTGIGPAGMAVVYQALMFENFDFRYEREYKAAHSAAMAQIAAGLQTPGNEAIEYFLQAGMSGIQGIHRMRRGEFLSALASGYDCVLSLGEAKRAAPEFIDPLMGDGMYMYWRTVVARSTALIPDGADEREAGKALIKQVEKEGVLMGPAATLALTYSYIEDNDLRNALGRVMYGRLRYPDNVINNLTAGRVLTSMRRYDEAVTMYQDVLRAAPDNQRAWYHLGVVYSRKRSFPDAEQAFKRYVAFPEVQPDYRGQAWYRLGLLYARESRVEDARAAYTEAVRVSKNEAARKALSKLP
jgi:tetratricopeptide (TPR) repeat protein